MYSLADKRFAVVDDELLIALDVERILGQMGAKNCVLTRRDALHSVLSELSEPIDLLIIDHCASDDGLAKMLETAASDIPVLLMTTIGEAELDGWLPRRFRLVQKPFSDRDISENIEALLCLAADGGPR